MTYLIDDRIAFEPKTRVTPDQYWALKAGQTVKLADGTEITDEDGPFRMVNDPPAPTERSDTSSDMSSDTTVMEKVLETLQRVMSVSILGEFFDEATEEAKPLLRFLPV